MEPSDSSRYHLRHQLPTEMNGVGAPQALKRQKLNACTKFKKLQQKLQEQKHNLPIQLNNQFDALDQEMEDDSQNEPNSYYRPSLQKSRAVNKTKTANKVKPIILWNTTHDIAKRFISSLGVKCNQQKLRSPNAIQVFPNTKEDKQKILEGLKQDTSRQYHTYTETEDRQLMFVLKGLERMDTDAVLTLLKDEKVPANKVTFIKDHKDYPIYKVSFNKESTDVSKLNNEHRYIDSLKVSWEKVNAISRRPTQCKRCQAWGHAATNCGRLYRCMKCKETHGPEKCKRTKEDESPPYCVNCKQEGHLSSSWNCESFKRYQQKIQSRRQIQQPREFTSTPAPWAQRNPSGHRDPYDQSSPSGFGHFPPLKGQNSSGQNQFVQEQSHPRPVYSQHLQSRSHVIPTLEDSQHEFESIPGIQEAMAILSDLYANLRNCRDSLSQAQIVFRFLQPHSLAQSCP
jgi:hypothetical protein